MPTALPTIDELVQSIDYNPETGAMSWKKDRGSRKLGDSIGCKDKHGYLLVRFAGALLKCHRVAFAIHHKRWPSFDIDHKNGIRTDNRISNLREANRQQNAMNQGLRSDNTSGHKGVHWRKIERKWWAQIQISGKCKSLGLYDDINEAINARRKAELELFGDFARVQ